MVRTTLVLDEQSLVSLRRLARRLSTSRSEVVRRSLRLLDQREASAPASPADALKQLAGVPAASLSRRTIEARIRKQRQDRRAVDRARE